MPAAEPLAGAVAAVAAAVVGAAAALELARVDYLRSSEGWIRLLRRNR